MVESVYTSDAIFETLKSEILFLTIKPGEPLGESILCDRFGVSRTPARAVLQRLHDGGLVDMIPYKGTFVTKLDYSVIDQSIYQRVALETFVMRDFIRMNNLAEHEAVRFALYQMTEEGQKFLDNDPSFDSSRFWDFDRRMHEIWFRAVRKPYLAAQLWNANASYMRFCTLDIASGPCVSDVLNEHAEMLDIIGRRDEAAIEPLMKQHLYGHIRRLGTRLYTEFRDYFVEGTLLV